MDLTNRTFGERINAPESFESIQDFLANVWVPDWWNSGRLPMPNHNETELGRQREREEEDPTINPPQRPKANTGAWDVIGFVILLGFAYICLR